jgi:predicted AlkP superfamily phosphohydrolase/phosphomutase
MAMNVSRIVHVGIDGGSFKVLDALAERNVMLEYRALRDEGGHAVLRSTTPWFTVPAWISWMTGVAAERHGLIYWTATAARDYWERGGSARRFVASSDVRYPNVFRILSNAGFRVASVNMPVTYPPPDIDGVVVSGFLAPRDVSRTAYPHGFLRRYPAYRIDVEDGPDGGPIQLRTDSGIAEYASAMTTIAVERHRVFMDLLRDNFQLASVVYVGTDRLSHVAWPQVESLLWRPPRTEGEEAVERYYRTLDRLLGETRRAAPDALLLVTSDHGQGPHPPRLIAPNAWLRDRGWLVTRAALSRRLSHRILPRSVRRGLWAWYRKLRNLPRGADPFVDWERTIAYGIPMPHCRAMGIAVRGDQLLQRRIADALLELIDAATGQRPVERVLFASDICREHASSTYPELVVLLADGFGAIGSVDGPTMVEDQASPSGYHEPDGVLIAHGTEVVSGAHPEVSICDITPTILSLSGTRPPDYMDGHVIPWLADGNGDMTRVSAEAETMSDIQMDAGEEERIAEHLRTLGYID